MYLKCLNGKIYVEVKDKRYIIHPIENKFLGLRDSPKSLRTQYQVQNETEIRKNQKVLKKDNNEMIVKTYPKKKKPNIQHPYI